MEIKRLLEKIVVRSAPGRFPSYNMAQVFKALELTARSRIGRGSLCASLGIGEGVMRTLVRHLLDEGLIEVSPRGISISKKGQQFLDEIHHIIKTAEAPNTTDTVGTHNYAVLVKHAFKKVRQGVEQRDAALLVGARGATTIVHNKDLWIPGMDKKPEKELSEFIEKNLSPDEGDVVIIGTGETILTAEIGALSAAIELV